MSLDEQEQDLDMALLRHWGFSFRDIAKEAGTAPQTVKNRLEQVNVAPSELETRAATLSNQSGIDPIDSRPKYVTVEEAAERAGVSDKTIRRHIQDGLLKAGRVGRQIRIPEDSFEDYMRTTNAKKQPANPRIRLVRKPRPPTPSK